MKKAKLRTRRTTNGVKVMAKKSEIPEFHSFFIAF
nr:MAG TPA: hypothetical protein [Caudoviricetes sp.]